MQPNGHENMLSPLNDESCTFRNCRLYRDGVRNIKKPRVVLDRKRASEINTCHPI